MSPNPEKPGALTTITRSIAAKLVLLVVVFFLVPLIIYGQFREADEEKRRLILRNLETQGRIIAGAVFPLLEAFDDETVATAEAVMGRLALRELKIRLLFRPAEHLESESFFYIASAPATSKELAERERSELIATGVLDRLDDSCEGNRSLAIRYENPSQKIEILTSLTSSLRPAGCWVLITSTASPQSLKSAVGEPYWKSTEVLVAAIIYLALALLVLSLFLGTWGALRRFARVARETRLGAARGPSFVSMNEVPELSAVAGEFDGLVGTLRESAEAIRTNAEESAHALKAPIGVIAQSLQPLKTAADEDKETRRRAVALIEKALLRMDDLINAARGLEEATAEAMVPPVQKIDVTALLEELIVDFAQTAKTRDVKFEAKLEPGIEVLGNVDMIETVIENLVANGLDYSPSGGVLSLTLEKGGRRDVHLVIADQGPGCPADKLETIFERHYSDRPIEHQGVGPGNFGMGLWLARRNANAMGGSIKAENREPRGLRMTVRLPQAR